MEPLTIAVTVLAFLLVAGYFAGGMLNQRRGQQLAWTLRQAFASSAEPRLTWLSRNVFRLELRKPLPRIQRVVATVALAPREAPLIWAYWGLRGRGDLLDMKADLATAPRGAGLIFDPRHRLGRAAWQAAVAAGGDVTEAGMDGLRMASYDAEGLALLERLVPLAMKAGDVVLVEVRAAQPRLTLLVSLRGAPRAATANLPEAMSDLAREVAP